MLNCRPVVGMKHKTLLEMPEASLQKDSINPLRQKNHLLTIMKANKPPNNQIKTQMNIFKEFNVKSSHQLWLYQMLTLYYFSLKGMGTR